MMRLPAPANVMLSAKTRFGFKAIQEYNLSEAKKLILKSSNNKS